MFGSTLYHHDIFNKNIQKFEFNYEKDSFAIRNSTNQEDKGFGSLVSQGIVDNKGRKAKKHWVFIIKEQILFTP